MRYRSGSIVATSYLVCLVLGLTMCTPSPEAGVSKTTAPHAVTLPPSPFATKTAPAASQAVAPPSSNRPFSQVMSETASGTLHDTLRAVQTPLEDIGLKRDPIPEVLQRIVSAPYVLPASLPRPLLCASIHREIIALDAILGSDVDAVALPLQSQRGQYIDKGAELARQEAGGLVSSHMNFIPFRGWVRRLSGAEKHAREVAHAYEAGKLRRAFLKGLRTGYQCEHYRCPVPNSAGACVLP